MVHVATQRGRAKHPKHRHPPRVHPVAPNRHPLASRDTPVAHTGEETTPSPHHTTGCAAHPSILFSPPGNGLSTLDARWKPLIEKYNSGIIRGDTVGIRSGKFPLWRPYS